MHINQAILHLSSISSLTTPTPTTYTTTLNFDALTVPTTSPYISNPPTPYANLNFSSLHVFNPSKHPYIIPSDINCAVSKPNALLGSISSNIGKTTISISNVSSIEPWFSLEAMSIKPLAAPDGSVTAIKVRGYLYQDSEAERIDESRDMENGMEEEEDNIINYIIEFPTEYHLPFTATFPGTSWRKLNKVEIWAEFGEDLLDWEFCIDDLIVSFVQKERQEDSTTGEDTLLSVGGLEL